MDTQYLNSQCPVISLLDQTVSSWRAKTLSCLFLHPSTPDKDNVCSTDINQMEEQIEKLISRLFIGS